MMGNHRDPWFAIDKAEHFVACFSITVAAATLLGFVRTELRQWRIAFGSLLGLTAGALKEAGDAIHLFPSDGASIKDGVADVLGVLCAASVLYYYYYYARKEHKDKSRVKLGDSSSSCSTSEVLQPNTIPEDV